MEEAYPLQWPIARPRTPAHKIQASRFQTTAVTARTHMLEEIQRMSGRNTIISTNKPLRRDGLPYASGREPDDSGVAVYFERKGDRVCFSCDQYVKIWENMRAIGKTIEAMRGIERWGSTEMLDQAFVGFAALPAPDAARPWREVLCVANGAPWSDIRSAYRNAMREASDTERYSINAAYDQAKEIHG